MEKRKINKDVGSDCGGNESCPGVKEPTCKQSRSEGQLVTKTGTDTEPSGRSSGERPQAELSPTFSGNNDSVKEEAEEYIRVTSAMHSSLQKYRFCRKGDCHETFIPLGEISEDRISSPYKDIYPIIKLLAKITAHVTTCYVSPERTGRFKITVGHKRTGTGWLQNLDGFSGRGPCPCSDCRRQGSKPCQKWKGFVLRTACHMIYDDAEARRTVAKFNFDSYDRSSVKTFEGVQLIQRDEKADLSDLLVVTHDTEFAEKLRMVIQLFSRQLHTMNVNLAGKIEPPYLVTIVSHPHGLSKHITMGFTKMSIGGDTSAADISRDTHTQESSSTSSRNDPGGGSQSYVTDVPTKLFIKSSRVYTADTCPGCSGAPVLIITGQGVRCWPLTHARSSRFGNISSEHVDLVV
ncbi:uncharacterized protein LOC101858138 isoform X1 [Aplysia californica]|uniref:Uncharacterized protein LOC101858138 isoform X1 n=1 Tax=Aplysia californica TaxID=6500 RepID=A0ABM0K6Q6_APLCA|nr:uncharacterized protein LOC101858138 isoform X1 [Aplysia californica]